MNYKRSDDYHDYVFSEGKFVGKFEDMYKNSRVIPWHQDQTAEAIFSDIDIVILKKYKFSNILDIGCGMGFFTNRCNQELHDETGARPQVTGIDVSSTAIEYAKKRFPGINFLVGDISEFFIDKKYDLIICKEIMWYIFPKLEIFIGNVKNMMDGGNFFYISQSFPETENFVGKEVIANPEQLLRILKNHFSIIYYCIEYDPALSNRPLIHLLMKNNQL